MAAQITRRTMNDMISLSSWSLLPSSSTSWSPWLYPGLTSWENWVVASEPSIEKTDVGTSPNVSPLTLNDEGILERHGHDGHLSDSLSHVSTKDHGVYNIVIKE